MVTALLGAHDLTVGTYTSPHLERINERISRNRRADHRRGPGRGAHRPGRHRAAPRPPAVVLRAAHRGGLPLVLRRGGGGRRRRGRAARAVGRHQRRRRHRRRAHQRRPRPHRRPGRLAPAHRRGEGRASSRRAPPSCSARPIRRWPTSSTARRRRRCGAATSTSPASRTSSPSAAACSTSARPGSRYEEVFLPLHGAHQGENAAVALAAAEAFFGRPLDPDLVVEAFAAVRNPGRFEVVQHDPLLILDGAHNRDGAIAAAEALAEGFAVTGVTHLVIGVLDGRDPAELLDILDAEGAATVRVLHARLAARAARRRSSPSIVRARRRPARRRRRRRRRGRARARARRARRHRARHRFALHRRRRAAPACRVASGWSAGAA